MFGYRKHPVALLSALLFTLSLFGQSPGPYYLNLKRTVLYGGTAIGTTVLGKHLRNSTPDLMLSDLHIDGVNGFDRIATRQSSKRAALWSDYTMGAAQVLPTLLLANRKSRRDVLKIGLLYAEVIMINQGLTDIVKSTFRRPRPYVFDENLPPETILRRDDRAAFLSGHTSSTAAASFFFARVFTDYFPDSRLLPYVWSVAAALPAATAYLRVRAGRHYPTDVIAGYALGASVGLLVPALHKKLPANRRLAILPTGGGAYLSYAF